MRLLEQDRIWQKVILIMAVMVLMCSGLALALEENVPGNLDECHRYLDELMSPSDQEKLKATLEGELDQYQASLGVWIQNVWLGESAPLFQYLEQLGVHYVDSMSGVVIRSYWCHLNQRVFDQAGAIAIYQEVERERDEQKRTAERKEKEMLERVQSNRVRLTVLPGAPAEVKIPEKMLWGGIPANDLIAYGRGYIINAICTYPKGLRVSYAYYYLDLVEDKLYQVQVSGVDAIESLVVNNGVLYVSGIAQNHRVVRRYADGKMEELSLVISGSGEGNVGADSWVKLGFYGDRLVALQRDGVYGYDEKEWKLLKRMEMQSSIIPTANIQIYGDRLYYYQEIVQGSSCKLYSVDLKGEEGPAQVLSDYGIDTGYKEMVTGYTMDAKQRLWIAATVGEDDALVSVEQNRVRYWVYDGEMQTQTGLQDISSRVVFFADQRVLVMGRTGLYELKDEVVEPLVVFSNSEQEMRVEEMETLFQFSPRNVAYLGEDAYLIGSKLGGLYKLWKQDGQYQMVAYDDRMLVGLPVWRVE